MNSLLYQIKDYEMAGNLHRFLLGSLRSGKSFRSIAEELSEVGTPVSKSTVANWIHQSV